MNKLALLGGKPLRTKPFSNRVSMGREEKEAVMRVMDSDVLSGFVGAAGRFFNGGPEVVSFESAWSEKYGFQHAISTNSWSTGLQVAIGALGIEPGDEVICPPYTMSASATVAMFYGGIPVFADIDPWRFSIDPVDIERKITARTKAIVVVHLFGCPADMDPILSLAKKYDLKIIEDAAQAPGVLYKGQPVGAIGDVGGFSLNFHKHIQTGEGGLIVTNNDDTALRCRLIRNHGENAADDYGLTDISNTLGSNYRYTELQAAIAKAQFEKLDDMLKHRAELASALDKRIDQISGLERQKIEATSTHAYYMYPIIFDADVIGISRSTFVRAVNKELPVSRHWDTTPFAEGYVKPLYWNRMYQNQIAIGKKGFPFSCNSNVEYDYSVGSCPVVEDLYRSKMLISPLVREGITLEDIHDFANAIEKVIANIEELKVIDSEQTCEIFDPVKAIDENVNKGSE